MNIVVTSPSFSNNKVLQEEIYKDFLNVKLNLDGKRFTQEELISYIQGADALIVGLEKIDKEVLQKCPSLKLIAKYGVGLNNIDIEECVKKGVQIGWTGGINRLSVAEMVLGYMLMLVRNLYITSNQLKNGIWNKSGGVQLSEKTIGIVGVGHIGKELVRLLKPFRCRILVNDIIEQEVYYKEHGLIEVSKETLFKEADIVTIHTPLNKTTENLISLDVMKTMKSSTFLINSARGGIINELDLKYALQNRIIAGAAIDAYVEEPPSDSEFLKLPNLVCTPHIGGNAQEAVEAMGRSAIHHLREYFNR